jgi:hypothetical protein
VGQADQRLGVGDSLAVDPAEGAVDQAAAYVPFALVEAPVVQVLEHQHSQDDSRRSAQAPPALTLRMTLGQRLRHPVDQALVVEQRVDAAEGGIPELVGVGQEYFDEATLLVRSPHHGASGEAGSPQRLHRVSCAAVRAGTSRGSLTIARCASIRQPITVHSDTTTTGRPAETRAALGPIRTGK